MLTQVHRPCPVCHATQAEILHHQQFLLPQDYPLPSTQNIVLCHTCGLAYADTTGTPADYDRYYSEYSKYADQTTSTGGGGNPADQARLDLTARFLAQNLPDPQTRVVDIGCANGGVLASLKTLGYTNLLGIDPSPACVHNTRALHQIPATQGWLLDLPSETAPADLVILSHVLEHVLHPGAALRHLHPVLSPGAALYIEVPDAQRYAECLVSPFQDFNTEHINHFAAASLENLAAAAGFTPLSIGHKTIADSSGHPYPAVFGLFRLANPAPPASPPPPWRHDPAFPPSLRRYIADSAAQLAHIDSLLAPHLHQPLIIWGAGQLTLKLLAETTLRTATIAAIVDNNPVNHGKTLHGVTIIPPADLLNLPPHPILIATLLHQNPITQQIRKTLNLPNPILTLHNSHAPRG